MMNQKKGLLTFTNDNYCSSESKLVSKIINNPEKTFTVFILFELKIFSH